MPHSSIKKLLLVNIWSKNLVWGEGGGKHWNTANFTENLLRLCAHGVFWVQNGRSVHIPEKTWTCVHSVPAHVQCSSLQKSLLELARPNFLDSPPQHNPRRKKKKNLFSDTKTQTGFGTGITKKLFFSLTWFSFSCSPTTKGLILTYTITLSMLSLVDIWK